MLVSLFKRTWFFQKADKIKNLFFDQFGTIIAKLEAQQRILESQEANDTAILQSLVHLVEESKSREEWAERLRELEQRLRELEQRLNETQARGVDALQQLQKQSQAVAQRLVDSKHYDSANPEVGLMLHLGSFLPARKALDIGANAGDVSSYLVEAGFEVNAFEPFPPVFEKLRARFNGSKRFSAHNFALGPNDGTATLLIATDISEKGLYEDTSLFNSVTPHSLPADMTFSGTMVVPMRSLESLHREGKIPSDVGLVKIDTEGFDLEVIRGMGDHRYPVVMAEFWDPSIDFAKSGALNKIEDLTAEMAQRNYEWYIVLYRIWGQHDISYYCNIPHSVEGSWGNIVFFQDHDLFSEAQKWCSAVLPPTYFKN